MPEFNVVELVVQGGALAVLLLVLFALAKYGSQFIRDMLDHLKAGVTAQTEVADALRMLCEKMNGCEDEMRGQGSSTARVLSEISTRLQTMEERAVRRHEQAMQHSDQRHTEILGLIKHLNGKT